ncbi:FTR1 family iron permease [Bacillus salipaludis]|uniref:FTR1 family iron permease n=1 Tax=Bacillus salipaludis TaxID=2547811 RepID=A0A4R5VN12_9BACI|nr:FTR1 family protein [Bacillus salipaludis]TDK59672.1 FTR1 family iron permease [Bacillus salipaludis]
MKTKIKLSLALFISLFMLILMIQPAAAAENHDELFVLIGDSLMKAKQGDQVTVSKNMEQFSKEWNALKKEDSKLAKTVNTKLNDVNRLLKEKADNEAITKGLSALSSAVVQYDQEQNPVDKEKGKEQVKNLLPIIDTMKESSEQGNISKVKLQYQTFMNQWTANETFVHDESISSYGNIEKYTALVRIAITQDPPDLKKAQLQLDQLTKEIENFLAGKNTGKSQETYSLQDLSNLLTKAEDLISQKDYQNASSKLNEVLTIWPMVEGDVQTRDSKLYNDIETKVPTAISILNSKNVNAQKASEIIEDLHTRLAPLLSKTDYSLWDAALILLREGLEALLIVATLLAFLKRMGKSSKQKWIWAGVGAGILLSAILAIFINILFSKLTAASSREYIEGITGIVAVLMMLTIGAWLHNKSSIGNWNKFINQQMEQAIAKGSLLSFAMISFLSVFREGAETIIFYAGITPYISLQQLVIGVLLAVVILAVVGFLIIKYSVKIPIRLFFKAATILIYVLAFKILGISVHALQISNMIPTTTVNKLPYVDWIGLYPTWETTLTQIGLLVIIFFMTYAVKKKFFRKSIPANV